MVEWSVVELSVVVELLLVELLLVEYQVVELSVVELLDVGLKKIYLHQDSLKTESDYMLTPCGLHSIRQIPHVFYLKFVNKGIDDLKLSNR